MKRFPYLGHAAQLALSLCGFQEEVVEVVLALVVHGLAEVELPAPLPDAEQPARVRQQRVRKGLALEGNSLYHCYSVKRERIILCFNSTGKDVRGYLEEQMIKGGFRLEVPVLQEVPLPLVRLIPDTAGLG